MVEGKAVALCEGDFLVIDVKNSVGEAACFADDRDGAVAHADHLRQAAWLKN